MWEIGGRISSKKKENLMVEIDMEKLGSRKSERKTVKCRDGNRFKNNE